MISFPTSSWNWWLRPRETPRGLQLQVPVLPQALREAGAADRWDPQDWADVKWHLSLCTSLPEQPWKHTWRICPFPEPLKYPCTLETKVTHCYDGCRSPQYTSLIWSPFSCFLHDDKLWQKETVLLINILHTVHWNSWLYIIQTIVEMNDTKRNISPYSLWKNICGAIGL